MTDARGMFANPAAMRVLQSILPGGAQAHPMPQQRWQDSYAAPDWQKRLTQLPPDREAHFQAWVRDNRIPITPDYDMRGFWQSGEKTQVNPNDHMIHYSDRYKTPLHQSFSGESIYANPASHPPMWNDRDQLVDSTGRVLFDERAQNQ